MDPSEFTSGDRHGTELLLWKKHKKCHLILQLAAAIPQHLKQMILVLSLVEITELFFLTVCENGSFCIGNAGSTLARAAVAHVALILRAVQCYSFWGQCQCPALNAVVLSNENLSSAKKYFPFYFCNKAIFPVCYHLIRRRLVTSTNHFVPSVMKIIAGNGLILLPVAEFDFFGCCMV